MIRASVNKGDKITAETGSTAFIRDVENVTSIRKED